MNTKFKSFLTGIALAAGMMTASATSVSVSTIPQGMISYRLIHGTSNYLSLPLTNTESYTSTVNTVTSNSISVADAPAPFTKSLAVTGSPYFVKFLTGNEAGRVVLITSNTTSALTLDTTDASASLAVPLTTTSFNVAPGDTFEIFPGDTLASIFGAGTSQSPLVLIGGASPLASDTVTLLSAVNANSPTYYFNTTAGHWALIGSTVNANSTIVYPYSAFAIDRQLTHSDTTMIVSGRVTPVGAQTKLVSQGSILTSTHFATDVKLSQLKFGSNWVMGATATVADNLSVWNPASNSFDTYYQKPDTTWRKGSDAVTDQSNFAIAAGAVTAIAKREVVTGGKTFLQSPLPYRLD